MSKFKITENVENGRIMYAAKRKVYGVIWSQWFGNESFSCSDKKTTQSFIAKYHSKMVNNQLEKFTEF